MKLIEAHQDKGKEEADDIDDKVVIHQRKKAKPSIVEVETSDTDDMEDTSDHEDAGVTERKETTREDSISNLIASVTKETIGGEAVEMLSFASDDTGVVGEVSSETVDL